MAQTNQAPARPTPSLSHRFTLPDFSVCGLWLLGELQGRWPHLDEKNIMGWLRGLIYSPEYLFLKNDKAVLLAQQIRENMEPRPVVIEIFCCAQDGGFYDAASLYTEMRRWAESLGARKMIVEEFTQVPRPMMSEAIGEPIVTEKLAVVHLKDTRPQ